VLKADDVIHSWRLFPILDRQLFAVVVASGNDRAPFGKDLFRVDISAHPQQTHYSTLLLVSQSTNLPYFIIIMFTRLALLFLALASPVAAFTAPGGAVRRTAALPVRQHSRVLRVILCQPAAS
jgi:hypothetical protein